MSRQISKLRLQCVLLSSVMMPSTVFGGARIDLRPVPPIPPGGYEPNTLVHVTVVMVDTGNPQGNIRFRGLQLDYFDSAVELNILGPDQSEGTPDDNEFDWVNPLGLGVIMPELPRTWWAFPLPVWPIPPGWVIELPDEGEVHLGDLFVWLPNAPGTYTMNALNGDEQNPDYGANAHFGYGQPNDDPPTTWRAFTGELTGGVLELPVIPEPASLALLSVLFAWTMVRRDRT